MKRFFITLLLVISLSPVALADEEGTSTSTVTSVTECSTFTGDIKTFEEVKEDFGDAKILTEISEPLGGFEDTLTSGGNQIVKVYWKFSCQVDTSTEGTTPSYETQDRYVAYEGTCPTGAECTLIQIIAGKSGIAILKTYIALVYRWAATIVGIVAVLVIVISGIQLSADQGSGEAVGAAKTRILQSLAGLAILFLSALILYTINPTFFQQ